MIIPTIESIRKKAENKYKEVLKAHIMKENLFPLVLKGTGISAKIPFLSRIKAINDLKKEMRTGNSKGFTLNFTEQNTRTHGSQSLLKNISFDTVEDYLYFINKIKEFNLFKKNIKMLRESVPELENWIIHSQPGIIIKHQEIWKDVIKVLLYFRDMNTKGLYSREIPLEVSTKFMERNQPLLISLIDEILPDERINKTEDNLMLRYGLKRDSAFRFRVITDPASKELNPFCDIAVLPEELACWKPSSSHILIIENKLSFLKFPRKNDLVKIWGSGKSVSLLKPSKWLQNKKVYYWGDMDPHGFEILSMLREFLPRCISICMDVDTYQRYANFAVSPGSYTEKDSLNLEGKEMKAYRFLVARGNKGCLEQERIPVDYAEEYWLKKLL